MNWEKEFIRVGAFWTHDGNLKRPYARWTSGKISNAYFNSERVAENAELFGEACEALVLTGQPFVIRDLRWHYYAIGAAMGSVKFAGRVAEAAHLKTAFAEKEGDELEFKRTSFVSGTEFLLTDDTVTTGGTLLKLKRAAEKASPDCRFASTILALCNESPHATEYGDSITLSGHRIVALMNRPATVWEEGHNPFTSDGKELVPPVRPKNKENWALLTRTYD